MDKKPRKFFTPIILRFGILHSYWRTLPILGLIFIVDVTLQFLDGITILWPELILLNLAVLIGIWVIRDAVAGYDELFDVFDSETEKKLKLYQSMDRPSSKSQEDIRNLFKDRKTYQAFRKNVRNILFGTTEFFALVFAIICFVVLIGYQLLFPSNGTPLGTSSLVTIRMIINITASFFITLFATSGIVLVFGYLNTISLLGKSSKDLRIWNYIDYLRGNRVSNGAFMTYEGFYDNTSTIGHFVYRFTLRIVVLEVIAALGILLSSLLSLGYISLVSWFFSLSITIASLVIFLIPLFSLHKVLSKAKIAILDCLKDEYNHLKIAFMSYLREKRTTTSTSGISKKGKDLATEINAIQTMILETRLQWTWAFRLPMALKVLGASLIPALTAIIEIFFF